MAIACLTVTASAQEVSTVPAGGSGNRLFGTRDPSDRNGAGDLNAFNIEALLDLLFGPDPHFCDRYTGDGDAFDIELFLNCLFPLVVSGGRRRAPNGG